MLTPHPHTSAGSSSERLSYPAHAGRLPMQRKSGLKMNMPFGSQLTMSFAAASADEPSRHLNISSSTRPRRRVRIRPNQVQRTSLALVVPTIFSTRSHGCVRNSSKKSWMDALNALNATPTWASMHGKACNAVAASGYCLPLVSQKAGSTRSSPRPLLLLASDDPQGPLSYHQVEVLRQRTCRAVRRGKQCN